MGLEPQFRIGVLAGGALLIVLISYMRFCGGLSLPPKPPPPKGPTGSERQLLVRSTGTPAVYQSYLEHDASAAGVRVPSVEDMSRKFPYRVDETRHVLELGKSAVEIAGLRVHLERTGDVVTMVIQNLVDADVAYEVTSAPSLPATVCMRASPLPFNAMVIAKGSSETRTECIWRPDLSIVVTRVETMDVPPLAGWYLSRLPPPVVGVEERIARGHRGADSKEKCSPVVSTVVRAGMDRGDIGWRDLADFYARHRCQSYQFPSEYRAFKSDGERGLPAVEQ